MNDKNIKHLIDNKDATICVIGLGQVGLPTALTFCESGFKVIGHDINQNLIDTLNSKKSPFEEQDLDKLIFNCFDSGIFEVTSDLNNAVQKSDIIIVCVDTPITDGMKPDMSSLKNICSALSSQSLKKKLLIIESSIPPGTFTKLVLASINKGQKLGSDFYAAFVPERLAPGNAFSEMKKTPRVIGYVDETSGQLAKILYEQIINSEIIKTPIEIAEISKLVENTFRDVNIAFANEVAKICEKYKIDVNELIRICNSHPRVNLLQPGPGVGGPCLPKDPYLLLNPQGKNSIDSKIILDSREINDSMPFHVINLIISSLNNHNKKIEASTILILGVAYKGNVSDVRWSPSSEIIPNLIKNGCNVLVFDPKTNENFGGKSIHDFWAGLLEADVLLILTDHDEFKQYDLKKISESMKKPPILVDTKRIFSKDDAEKLGIDYIAVGYSKY